MRFVRTETISTDRNDSGRRQLRVTATDDGWHEHLGRQTGSCIQPSWSCYSSTSEPLEDRCACAACVCMCLFASIAFEDSLSESLLEAPVTEWRCSKRYRRFPAAKGRVPFSVVRLRCLIPESRRESSATDSTVSCRFEHTSCWQAPGTHTQYA